MKKSIHILTLFLLVNTVSASAPDTSSSAYKQANFLSEAKRIEYSFRESGESVSLYYNAGTCYLNAGDTANARWCYEKALKINPAHSASSHNLNLLLEQSGLQPDQDKGTLSGWFWSQVFSVAPNFWAVFSIVVLNLGFLLLILLRLNKLHQGRKLVVYLSGAILLIGFVSVYFTFIHRNHLQHASYAVIMQNSLQVKNEASENSKDIMLLRAGEKIKLKSEIPVEDKWIEVELGDGKSGWVEFSNIKLI